jgi:hypothetical protein
VAYRLSWTLRNQAPFKKEAGAYSGQGFRVTIWPLRIKLLKSDIPSNSPNGEFNMICREKKKEEPPLHSRDA